MTLFIGISAVNTADATPGRGKSKSKHQKEKPAIKYQYKAAKKKDKSKSDASTNKTMDKAYKKKMKHRQKEVRDNRKTYGTKESRRYSETHNSGGSYTKKGNAESSLKKYRKPISLFAREPYVPH